MTRAPDTAPIRAGEELPAGRLREYLSGRIEGVEEGIAIEQFPGGHSNLTYLVAAGGKEYVLRRAPHGPVPPRAHDMARECRVLQAVHPYFPPAPKPYLLCEDSSVIGAVFFLMERRRGVVLRSRIPTNWAANPDLPRLVSKAFLECLVQLHSVEVTRTGLIAMGKPDGFVGRQVRGWSERWLRARTEEMPRMERVIEYLRANLPPEAPPALVHNDFKLDNLMLRADGPGTVEAVLDWEMATVGDPLVDIGLTLCYWDPPDEDVRDGPVTCLTRGPGWMTGEELAGQWAERTKRSTATLRYHEILGIFKLAVIVQQIYFRWFRGQTGDERFASFHRRVKLLVEAAYARVEAAA